MSPGASDLVLRISGLEMAAGECRVAGPFAVVSLRPPLARLLECLISCPGVPTAYSNLARASGLPIEAGLGELRRMVGELRHVVSAIGDRTAAVCDGDTSRIVEVEDVGFEWRLTRHERRDRKFERQAKGSSSAVDARGGSGEAHSAADECRRSPQG